MQVTASGVVYDGNKAPPHRQSCAFTTVYLARDGALLVSGRWGSQRDSPDGHPLVWASTDGGDSWEKRYDGYQGWNWDVDVGENKGMICTELGPGVLTATSLWVDRSRTERPFINLATQGLLPMRIAHSISQDGGRSWGPPRRMDTSPHRAASPCSHAILSLADGVLAQPYEQWKEYDDESPGRPAARLRFSRDGGTSWPDFATVAQHPDNALYYWDQRLAVHPNSGQLAAMFWTHDAAAGRDIDVHIAWGSADGGQWTVPTGTGLPGQHCQPLGLGGDRLLAVYTQRGEPPGIAASVSEDFGQTWQRGRDVMVYDSTAGTELGAGRGRSQAELWGDMERWRFGHPRAVLLSSGEVLVVFYAGGDHIKSVRWVRLGV